MNKKKCIRCKKNKELSEFHKENASKDGIQSRCKKCFCELSRKNVTYTIIEKIKNINGEIWKEIIGWEGLYQISNMGRVRSLKRLVQGAYGERILPQCLLRLTYEEYISVTLTHNKKRSKKKVHRLVGEAFIPNPDNYPVINHLKGNKYDNRSTELEWTTYQKNSLHSFEIGLQSNKGEKHPRAKLTLQKVNEIRQLLELQTNVKEIAKQYNVDRSLIYYIKNGKIWSS